MGVQAYRLACHYGDSEEQVHETMKISSSAVFSKLMLFVLKEVGLTSYAVSLSAWLGNCHPECCAVLCCAVLCCAVLCWAVLCCAVLCCAVLCCAVLCC